MKDKLSIAFGALAGFFFISGLMIIAHPIDNGTQNLKSILSTTK